MTLSELQTMTVIQLRKVARENNIVLGAGVDKASIVSKIAGAMKLTPEPEQLSFSEMNDLSVFPEKEDPQPVQPVVEESSAEILENSESAAASEESTPEPAVPVPRISSASFIFASCIARTRSSTVPFMISLYTVTFRCCPIRCARSVAWFCTARFHQGS